MGCLLTDRWLGEDEKSVVTWFDPWLAILKMVAPRGFRALFPTARWAASNAAFIRRHL